MFFCKYREIVKNISGGCFNRYLDPIKDHRKDIAGVRTNPSLHQSDNALQNAFNMKFTFSWFRKIFYCYNYSGKLQLLQKQRSISIQSYILALYRKYRW